MKGIVQWGSGGLAFMRDIGAAQWCVVMFWRMILVRSPWCSPIVAFFIPVLRRHLRSLNPFPAGV